MQLIVHSSGKVLTLEVTDGAQRSDLTTAIEQALDVSQHKQKLLHKGKVLEASEPLAAQGVKAGSKIMLIASSTSTQVCFALHSQVLEAWSCPIMHTASTCTAGWECPGECGTLTDCLECHVPFSMNTALAGTKRCAGGRRAAPSACAGAQRCWQACAFVCALQ